MSRSLASFITIFLFLYILPSVHGQNGKLMGRVTDSANGEGMMMAVIRIDSTTFKCIADEKGNFVIAPGETKVINFILGDMNVNMLNGFEVWAVEQTNNDKHLTREIRQSDGVVVGYTGVTSTRNGDPSVADGIKRMPG